TLKGRERSWPTSGSRAGRGPEPRVGLRVGVTVRGVPQKMQTFAAPGGSARAQRGQFAGAAISFPAAMPLPAREAWHRSGASTNPEKSSGAAALTLLRDAS